MFLEIQGAAEFAECWNILKSHGYEIFGIEDDTASLIRYDGSDAAQWMANYVGHRVLNYLCVARSEHFELAKVGVARIRSKMHGL